MDTDIAIKVGHLSKSFIIPLENRNTFKEKLFHFRKKTSYEKFQALHDITFSIKKGEFFGIIGRNGSGKSTLLKILSGIYTPDKGTIEINGDISPFLELGVGFNPELSGKDNIFLNATLLGLSKKEIRNKYESIVAFSELARFIHLKLKNYSSGMQMRLAFAISVHTNKEIYLMDEVLAVGDANFKKKCLNEFSIKRKKGNTVILITHDLQVVQQYCERVLLLVNGKIHEAGAAEKVVNEYIRMNKTDFGNRIL